MNISEFIINAIEQIKNGIDKTNELLTDTKVDYPKEIDFELWLDSAGELAEKKDQESIKATITLSMTNYSWKK